MHSRAHLGRCWNGQRLVSDIATWASQIAHGRTVTETAGFLAGTSSPREGATAWTVVEHRGTRPTVVRLTFHNTMGEVNLPQQRWRGARHGDKQAGRGQRSQGCREDAFAAGDQDNGEKDLHEAQQGRRSIPGAEEEDQV